MSSGLEKFKGKIRQISDVVWEIPTTYKPGMRVRAVIYADQDLLSKMAQDATLEQAANVTTLPGIEKFGITLPDGHEGYGFPIGGVAATDIESGVISPGGVGYDINCLSGDSLVLHEHGYRRPIREFEARWNRERISCVGLEGVRPTEVARFLRARFARKVYRVETSSGHAIIATEDHPFLTRRGMVPLGEIGFEDVAVYPFEGVAYDSTNPITILTDEDIKRLDIPGRKDLVISELKKRGLLPLTSDNESFPYLLKLVGFILGDGTLIYTKRRRAAWFFADAEDLEDVRNDVRRTGFVPSKVYSRKRRLGVRTKYDEYSFETREHSIKVSSRSFISLLAAMGVPLGNKASQDYGLPGWLFKLPLWQKRLFLASFFGAELSKPKTVTGHPYNFYMPALCQNKKNKHEGAGLRFLDQIASLLGEFDVRVEAISKEPGAVVGKNGVVSTRLRLLISATPENLVKLWGRIGFEYNREKKYLANLAVQYLKLKMQAVEARKNVELAAVAMKSRGVPNATIYENLESKYVSRRFIERPVYEGREGPPRAPPNFPTFKDFMESATEGLGRTGTCWDRIVKREEILFDEDVYDFTVKDVVHNFIANGFVVSNCGVRLLTTNLDEKDVRPLLPELLETIFSNVPSGLGSSGKLKFTPGELDRAVVEGIGWAIKKGYGTEEDAEHCEENGAMPGADPAKVSSTAKSRGAPQLGSLGSGNHFLEIDVVDKIYDDAAAKAYGVTHPGQVVVFVHTGSRGYGHQICSDYLQVMERAVKKYNINLPDRELSCAPGNSPEAKDYFAAMACAVNYAFLNRQIITHWVRESFEKVFRRSSDKLGLESLYDVCHNIAKIEEHSLEGGRKKVIVHRKGATRAFPPGSALVPEDYRPIGQPVLIPGSMGTSSWILKGTEQAMSLSFGSTAHGAGRYMSRAAAIKKFWGSDVKKKLEGRGILVRAANIKVISEEAPEAYKDCDSVADVSDRVGLAKKVARLVPIGVTKG